MYKFYRTHLTVLAETLEGGDEAVARIAVNQFNHLLPRFVVISGRNLAHLITTRDSLDNPQTSWLVNQLVKESAE